MLDLTIHQENGRDAWIETSVSGKQLLSIPQLNKGTAFTEDERHAFGLLGKLPSHVETLDEQIERSYQQFQTYHGNLKKNIFLNNLHDTNQVLFYALVRRHLASMIPVIYTPIVGTAVKQFSVEFRHPRGLYISYPDRDYIDEILDNRSNPDIDLIVVTDGEGVLGIGDQGIGGMDIPVAKLMVYTLCGGINALRTLPILLDVGTNNQALLDDPLYLGWRHKRIAEKDYDEFIHAFICAIKRKFPHVFLHWEDFGARNARRNLDRYRDEICTFNDDMQGTGVVTLSAILAASKALKQPLAEHRIIVFGAGTAGTGIADQIVDAMCHEGLSKEEATTRFWLIDRAGLLVESTEGLTDFQKPYARPSDEVKDWNRSTDDRILLEEVVKHIKPTILIGCSAQTGAFHENIIKTMAASCKHPIILPLSNPTEKAEATPANIIQWTDGHALIATGSPFDPVEYNGHTYSIAQCNNALVYPGIGLGVIACKTTRLMDEMLWAACQGLIQMAPVLNDLKAPLLPPLEDAPLVAKQIAQNVAEQAIQENLAKPLDYRQIIDDCFWEPHYLPYRFKQEVK